MMAFNKGTMKKLGIGCLVILCVLAVVGIVGGLKLRSAIKAAGGWEPFVRQKSAEYMRTAVSEAVAVLPLNTLEKQSITEPVRVLSERMSKGEITVIQSGAIVDETYRSPLPAAVLALYFQRKFVKDGDTAAMLTVNRFVGGILSGKITGEDSRRFSVLLLADPHAMDRLSQPRGDGESPGRNLKLKDDIPPEDIAKCLEMMKNAADKAGMPFIRTDLNFTPMIDGIIGRALEARSAAAPQSAATPKPAK